MLLNMDYVFFDVCLSLLFDFRARKEFCRKWLLPILSHLDKELDLLLLPSFYFFNFFLIFSTLFSMSELLTLCIPTVISKRVVEPDPSWKSNRSIVDQICSFYRSTWIPVAEKQRVGTPNTTGKSLISRCG